MALTADSLRTLLIDCRIALRATIGQEEHEALHQALESAIRELTQATLPAASTSTKTSAQQVALAWQTASRSLRLSHPELYEELSQKVMALLDTRELVEPVTELLQLEAEVERLQAEQKPIKERLEQMRQRASESSAALEALRLQLQEAAPEVTLPSDPQGLALARIQALQQRVYEGAPNGGGSGIAPPVAQEPNIPNRTIAEQVAAGDRAFSKEQREWVIGEALGVTGWQYTPVELLEKGEPWLARCLLDAGAVQD